jgi:hypothetical protein
MSNQFEPFKSLWPLNTITLTLNLFNAFMFENKLKFYCHCHGHCHDHCHGHCHDHCHGHCHDHCHGHCRQVAWIVIYLRADLLQPFSSGRGGPRWHVAHAHTNFITPTRNHCAFTDYVTLTTPTLIRSSELATKTPICIHPTTEPPSDSAMHDFVRPRHNDRQWWHICFKHNKKNMLLDSDIL